MTANPSDAAPASEVLCALVAEALLKKGFKLVTAESCTGGMIAAACTDLAGSSAWFERGFVTYSNDAKTELLGVEERVLRRAGAVCGPVAKAMAEGRWRIPMPRWRWRSQAWLAQVAAALPSRWARSGSALPCPGRSSQKNAILRATALPYGRPQCTTHSTACWPCSAKLEPSLSQAMMRPARAGLACKPATMSADTVRGNS